MSLCVINPIETHDAKINKYALKLLGIGHFELTDEEILECVSKYIEPTSIEALLFDTFNNFYILFLVDIDSACRLVGKKLELRSYCISIYPLLDCYVVDNVYPCLKNDELRDIFRTFGNVFTVTNHRIVPNSSKFSHVLSGKREVTFLLPGKDTEIFMPINVLHPPYSFHVRKFCNACLTEGHSILRCPDIEDDHDLPKLKCAESDSDGELDALIKSENIDIFDENKVETSVPDTQFSCSQAGKMNAATGGTSMEMENSHWGTENNIANTEKDVEMKQHEVVQGAPEEEKHLKSTITNNDGLTEVVSTSTVCRFAAGKLPPPQRIVKGSDALLPKLAEQLINETCGSFIIEANVMKQLVITDGRLKAEIIKFAFSYLDDLDDLLRLSRLVIRRCRKEKRFASLHGAFTAKMKIIQNILSDINKTK